VNLAVSNIPGSRDPLFLWESPMLGLHPFINVVGNLALIIGVLSYVDGLGVGITVDPDVVGDPDTLVPHLRDAMAELVTLVR
jgi:diacylglycerol O-acyltransferase